MTLQSEINSIYQSSRGGFFIDINQHGIDPSPTQYLENEYWSGVCMSDNQSYLKNRKCYTCAYDITNNLYERDGFANYKLHSKIHQKDKSTLYHLVYINVDNCVDTTTSLLKSIYEKPYEIQPEIGFWPHQILFLAVVVQDEVQKIPQFKNLCESYFLQYYNTVNNTFIFKNKILSNI